MKSRQDRFDSLLLKMMQVWLLTVEDEVCTDGKQLVTEVGKGQNMSEVMEHKRS